MTIPTPQEVHNLIARLRRNPEFIGNIEEAAAALSAYQQEVATLRERVAPLDEGPVCLLADYQAMRERAEAAEARVRELEQERDNWRENYDKATHESDARAETAYDRGFTDAHEGLSHRQIASIRQSAFAEAAQDAWGWRCEDKSCEHDDCDTADKIANALLAKATPPIPTEEP
jgi:chromosome segregation ATPase